MAPERLHRLALRQHSLFTGTQAEALGLTARQVDGGARAGWWHRVYRGVFRMAGAPVTEVQLLLAAVLASGPGAMASHRAAAWLWGLVDDLHLEVSAARRRMTARDAIVHHRSGAGVRPVVRRGVPCTDPLRTMVDLAGRGDEAVVVAALDRGIADGLFTAAAVEAEVERSAGRGVRGVVLLRRCLRRRLEADGERPSALESAMDRVLVGRWLPRPERQHRPAGTRYRLDYAWPEARLAVEVDGYGPHSGREAFQHDRRRQNDLVLSGWTVLRFTWADVRERPAVVAAAVRQALGASRPA